MTALLLYTTEDGRSQIKLRAEQQTVWLTQLEMAELFDATKQSISLHLKNLFQDGELSESSVVKESLTVQTEGSRGSKPLERCNRRVPARYPGRQTSVTGIGALLGWLREIETCQAAMAPCYPNASEIALMGLSRL